MDEVPYKSKRKGVDSIAGALGISEKTAREWIKEVKDTLKGNQNVMSLKKLRAGESI
jgi:5'-3' exonuclease